MSANFSSKDFGNVFKTFLVAKSLCKIVFFNDSNVFRSVTRISFLAFLRMNNRYFFLLRLFRKVFEKAKLVVSQRASTLRPSFRLKDVLVNFFNSNSSKVVFTTLECFLFCYQKKFVPLIAFVVFVSVKHQISQIIQGPEKLFNCTKKNKSNITHI